jgi:beta-xylosidase
MRQIMLVFSFIFVNCQVQGQQKWAPWTKYPDNPVYSSADSGFAASDPSVLYEDGKYFLYYTDVDSSLNATIISLATSEDGIAWSYQGRLLEANPKNWDAAHETAAIWKEEDKPYQLFYIGYQPKSYPPEGFYPADIGLARSEQTAGPFETVGAQPFIARTPGWYDNDMMASPDIIKIKVENTYYMVYAGHCYENCRTPVSPGVVILGASSSDLISWTKLEQPVLQATPELPWMAAFVAEPALLAAPNGKYYLFFTAFASWEENTPTVIGVAEGDTPFGPWQINPEPIVVGTEEWETAWTGAPDVLLENNVVKLWYFGSDALGFLKIGYATAAWPLRK